ncbi:MAG: hypothetical protein WCA82_08475 [Jiangellales bacterium]
MRSEPAVLAAVGSAGRRVWLRRQDPADAPAPLAHALPYQG